MHSRHQAFVEQWARENGHHLGFVMPTPVRESRLTDLGTIGEILGTRYPSLEERFRKAVGNVGWNVRVYGIRIPVASDKRPSVDRQSLIDWMITTDMLTPKELQEEFAAIRHDDDGEEVLSTLWEHQDTLFWGNTFFAVGRNAIAVVIPRTATPQSGGAVFATALSMSLYPVEDELPKIERMTKNLKRLAAAVRVQIRHAHDAEARARSEERSGRPLLLPKETNMAEVTEAFVAKNPGKTFFVIKGGRYGGLAEAVFEGLHVKLGRWLTYLTRLPPTRWKGHLDQRSIVLFKKLFDANRAILTEMSPLDELYGPARAYVHYSSMAYWRLDRNELSEHDLQRGGPSTVTIIILFRRYLTSARDDVCHNADALFALLLHEVTHLLARKKILLDSLRASRQWDEDETSRTPENEIIMNNHGPLFERARQFSWNLAVEMGILPFEFAVANTEDAVPLTEDVIYDKNETTLGEMEQEFAAHRGLKRLRDLERDPDSDEPPPSEDSDEEIYFSQFMGMSLSTAERRRFLAAYKQQDPAGHAQLGQEYSAYAAGVAEAAAVTL